ncbi:MAG TPA: flagellar biosynthesis protein FlaG, partial [Clostridiaceae bacterium]|nr:flagellar biosynthesis protein FlaG [Clostridiaceae bacterium]
MEINSIELNNQMHKIENKNVDKVNANQNRAAGTKGEKIDGEQLEKAVERANNVLFKNNTHLKFQIHDKTRDVMVEIIDDETGEVLKEIPPKKIIDMIA